MKKYLLLIFVFIFVEITINAQVCLVTHLDYSFGTQSYKIVTADFNNYGNLE